MSIGPVINKKQLAAHLARIAAAKAAGAKQIVGGEPQGQALPPHVFVDVRYEMKIAQEEAFGPIAPIIKVNGVEVPRFLKKRRQHGHGSRDRVIHPTHLDFPERAECSLNCQFTSLDRQTFQSLLQREEWTHSPKNASLRGGINFLRIDDARRKQSWALQFLVTEFTLIEECPRVPQTPSS